MQGRVIKSVAALALGGILQLSAVADEEAPNTTFVKSSRRGEFYAKCIPADLLGTNGTTRILRVRPEQDELVATFPWYARGILLIENSAGLCMVRLGPWPSGCAPRPDHLAVEFYLDGKLLKSYSTEDVIGKGGYPLVSVGHYQAMWPIGYNPNDGAFEAWTYTEGQKQQLLSFDLRTGELTRRPFPQEAVATQPKMQRRLWTVSLLVLAGLFLSALWVALRRKVAQAVAAPG